MQSVTNRFNSLLLQVDDFFISLFFIHFTTKKLPCRKSKTVYDLYISFSVNNNSELCSNLKA